jgi:hypothetical protein
VLASCDASTRTLEVPPSDDMQLQPDELASISSMGGGADGEQQRPEMNDAEGMAGEHTGSGGGWGGERRALNGREGESLGRDAWKDASEQLPS